MTKKLLFFFILINNSIIGQYAVVTKPVADAFFQPYYLKDKIYLAPDEKNLGSCARGFQLIFNELVKINKKIGSYFEIEVFNAFYENESNIKKNTFWTHQNNLKKLNILKRSGIDLAHIPKQYNKDLELNNILILNSPWYDRITKKTYSAGTRFIRENKFDYDGFYAIVFIDYKKLRLILSYIPKKLALINYPRNNTLRIKCFVSLLKQWANQKNFIPYVWGGNSFIKTYSLNNFFMINDSDDMFWTRHNTDSPASGIDCSSLILRVAQICGLPYFYKNSFTINKRMKPLGKNEHIEEGDIIWYPGHVLVVSDLKNNKIIESAGYPLGYGKVHEIEISKVFEDIQSFKDLELSFFNKKIIKRIDINRKIKRILNKFSILKLNSIWKISKNKSK